MKTISFVVLFIVSFLYSQQQLQIVAVTPTGAVASVDQVDAIAVTFSEPMTSLQAVTSEQRTGYMTFSPAVSGKFRWQGTSTLVFTPDKRLARATAYVVSIPAGIRSVSGKKLEEAFEWRFVTPAPSIVSVEPANDQNTVELDHSIMVQFNQPVNPFDVAKYISVEVRENGASTYPGFKTMWNGKGDTDRVFIRTERSFPYQATVTVKVKSGVKGKEGPLSMSTDYQFQFRTINHLAFAGIVGGEFVTPGHSLRLSFTTPVYEKDLLSHLRFTPSAPITDRDYYSDYPSMEWYVNLELLPERTYNGIILPGMSDRFGQTIKDTVKFSFITDAYSPYYSMPTGIGLLEAYANRRIPISTVNIENFELKMGRIDPEKLIALRRNFTSYGDLVTVQNGKEFQTPESHANDKYFTFSRSVKPKAKRNTVAYYYAGLDTVLGKTKLGTVLLYSSERNSFYQTLVNVSNIGVTAKFSPVDILVWTTKLKDASAVAGADVEIRNDDNAVLWKGKTGKDGTVKAPGWGKLGINTERTSDEYDEDYYSRVDRPHLWVFVKNGNDFAYSSSTDESGIDPWSFDINYEWSPSVERVQGSLFSDRGLYKAGEKIDLKGIIRSLKDGRWNVLKGDSVRVSIKNSRDEEMLAKELTLSSFGSVNASMEFPSNAPMGYYSAKIELKIRKDNAFRWMTVGYHYFRLEAFRAAEFDVTTVLGKKSYIVGDSVDGVISAKYLFGAALKNAPVRWRLTVSGDEFEPSGFDGYYFSRIRWLSPYDRSHYRELQNEESTLDEFGNLQIASRLVVGEIRSTASLMLEADATSPSRQVISGRTSVTIHNGEFYLGIGQNSTFVKKDTAVALKVIAVTPEGAFVPNVQVKVNVYNRIWSSVRRAEVGGRYFWESHVENIPVDSATVTTGTQPVEFSFVPKDPGFYYTEVNAVDPRGNEISANSYFYVTGSGYVPWERTNDDRIELISDRSNYKPGDVAHIIVKNPYESADALVSVEREGILTHFTVKVKGSAPQIDIPIKNDYLPNVFVSVVLLQGRVDSIAATKESDIGRPSFKMGYINLSVSPLEKKLSVKIETTKKDYRPGDSVEVSVLTTLSTGKPISSEVALSVADLGVLNLIGYRLPELFDEYYRQRGLAVSTTESRAHLIEQRNFGEKAEEVGGGGAAKMSAQLDADGVRKDFRASAYWNPSIITDAKGKAVIKFKLPDNITGFQLMAVAHTQESEFGFGENSITVSKPLLLQPAFPRFARVGDVFEGGVVALNYSDREKNVKLVSKVEGVVSESPDTVLVVLKPGESKEIRLRLNAVKIGTAKFTFRAYTDDDYDGMQWSIPVQVPRIREAAASSGSITEASASEKITKPTGTFEDLGSFDVTASSTQLVGLQNSVQYLFEYPYGCLEQKMSRILPMIIGEDMVRSFKLEILKGKDHKKVVQDILDETPLYQQSGGGFTLWKNQYESTPNPYLSAFAMYGLTMAKLKNYRVERSEMDMGMEYIRQVLTGAVTPRYSWEVDASTKALVLYVLALNGKPDYGYMEKLYADRAKLPLEARAYLLRALKKANGNAAMISTLGNDFMNYVKYSPTTAHFEERTGNDWWWTFYSNVRTTALVMQALTETQPTNQIIPKVVRWLLDQQRNGMWRSTQENLYVVDALSSYFAIYEKDEPKFTAAVSLAGQQILKESFEGRTLRSALASTPFTAIPEGTSALSISKNGPGRMYYTMRLNYFPKVASAANDQGFAVSKTVEFVKKDSSGHQSIAIGTIAKVTVTITTSQDRPYVVVDDPIPAGFEIINTSFNTTGSNLSDGGSYEDTYYYSFNHKEQKDDRALFFADYLRAGLHSVTYLVRATSFGTFQIPSTKVEQMYEPEVFGQTASGVITIH
ncbi:MAG: Ig-like domain-containing protein [Bacteroidota bacterium]